MDNFRLKLRAKEVVPIMIGGMGADISTASMTLEAARLGGVGHVSDAGLLTVCDRYFGTEYVKNKVKNSYHSAGEKKESFFLHDVSEAQRMNLEKIMSAKKGDGYAFVNCMEKLTMNDSLSTLKTRLHAALDSGIDGITLSAGLHLKSFSLIEDHPRFLHVNLGVIVSSLRALKIFIRSANRCQRLPDYVVVEGPMAGGHLGFSLEDVKKIKLANIVEEVSRYLNDNDLNIPVIAAGGVFTSSDGVELIGKGAAAIQVATRFTVTEESGFPDEVKQNYFKALENDVEVNLTSPTGYPIRMLKQSPSSSCRIKPRCGAYGYLLDDKGYCSYQDYYNGGTDKKTCLCSQMVEFSCWTCGENVHRLKETAVQNLDGNYVLPTTEKVFKEYQFNK